MGRKGSKAASTEDANDFLSLKSQDDDDAVVSGERSAGTSAERLTINPKYAERYNARKRREELMKARSMGISDSDESTSESEDEDAELLTQSKDRDIMRTLELIKNKDPRIYDEASEFYQEENETETTGNEKKKKTKKMYAKDFIRHQVLGDVKLQELPEKPTGGDRSYPEEQAAMKQAFAKALEGDDAGDENDASDDDLFEVKKSSTSDDAKSPPDRSGTTKVRRGITQEQKNEAWLRKFVMEQKWRDESDADAFLTKSFHRDIVPVDDEEDLEELEKTDDFERQYNFRYEEEDGSHLQSYSRTVEGTLRRKTSKRKMQREARKKRKEEEKRAKREELKRLKNLKRQEIMAKLREIESVSGMGSSTSTSKALESIDLDAEWDPDAHEKQMAKMFGKDYYAEDDEEMTNVLGEFEAGEAGNSTDEADADAHVEPEEDDTDTYGAEENADVTDARVDTSALAAMQQSVEEKMKELDAMGYEDIVGGMPTRFKYKKVEPSSYGLTTEQILTIPEKFLKQYVPLNKLAPYRERKFIVTGDKRRRWLREMRRRLEQDAQEKSAAAVDTDRGVNRSTPKSADVVAAATTKKKKKKKKRRSRKKSKTDTPIVASKVVARASETETVDLRSKFNSGSNGSGGDDDVSETSPSSPASSTHKKRKKKKKKKSESPGRKKSKKSHRRRGGLSQSRLAAYGL